MTNRPLNACRDCDDTWHPRGRDLSNKCPGCGSSDTYIVPFESDLSDFFLGHAWRCGKWFTLMSAPVFLIAAAVAPSGVNRLEYGTAKVVDQHAFLWHHGTNAVKTVGEAIYDFAAPIVDNGASS